jgi:hypothetical protein
MHVHTLLENVMGSSGDMKERNFLDGHNKTLKLIGNNLIGMENTSG